MCENKKLVEKFPKQILIENFNKVGGQAYFCAFFCMHKLLLDSTTSSASYKGYMPTFDYLRSKVFGKQVFPAKAQKRTQNKAKYMVQIRGVCCWK